MEDNNSNDPIDVRRYRGKSINLDTVQRRFQTALSKESEHILEQAYKGKLDKVSSDSLDKYLKLIKILKQMEAEVPDEELEQISKKTPSEDDEE